jgi:AhpD family alkylhydroperoxidase
VFVLLWAMSVGASEADTTRAEIQAVLGFLPTFIKQVPDVALPGAWEEMKTLQMNPQTALSPKQKELLGLAVAAQIPCEYCIVAHTEFAKANGATATEIGEAIAIGAQTRHWSTFFNGMQTDEAKFKADIMKAVDNAKKAMAQKSAPPEPMKITDAASVYKEVEMMWGFVPDFIKQFPPEAVAGAWREMRDMDGPKTALDGKSKSLIGLAVAAQVPCKFCVVADTEFAKLGGASDREVREAVAMAALVRHWSTLLNGLQVDKATFRKDVMKMIESSKKMKSATR